MHMTGNCKNLFCLYMYKAGSCRNLFYMTGNCKNLFCWCLVFDNGCYGLVFDKIHLIGFCPTISYKADNLILVIS